MFDRVFDVAIVDEVDHQLVDQARTPLIISDGPTHEAEAEVGDRCEDLTNEVIERQAHYVDDLYARIDEESQAGPPAGGDHAGRGPHSEADLHAGASERIGQNGAAGHDQNERRHGRQPAGVRSCCLPVDVDGPALRLTEGGWRFIWERADVPTTAFEVVQMLRARVVHDSDEDYVIDEDRVTLVDPLDGRPMHSHRYMDGLHEALEAKEGIAGRGRNAAKARTTIHALLSNYETVGGLTGTAIEASEVFANAYGVETVRVPSNVPSRRNDLGATVFFDRAAHLEAVSDEVAHWHRMGRPVLLTVGTVRQSAEISDELSRRRGVDHRVLNAGNPTREAEIVAGAGEPCAVTVSTAMAGRGTDIIVGPEVDDRIVAGVRRIGAAQCDVEGMRSSFDAPLMVRWGYSRARLNTWLG